MTTTNQKKITTILGMAYPAAVLALATDSSYPAPPGLSATSGLVHWQGTHHVFHQANPDSVCFGTMTWGHVASTDLVHWTREEPALVPSQPAGI
jgi:Glycosyl hydrolases family 32 N-terminal domain